MTTLIDDIKPNDAKTASELERKIVVVTEADYFKLDSLHRCDRCSAQAYFEVELPSGGNLLFCSHHYKASKSALLPIIVRGRDESAKLN